jgi:hypothetical protein
MNDFQNTNSGQGMLKLDYDPSQSPQLEALKRRRAKLGDKIAVPDKEDAESSLSIQGEDANA